MRWGSAAALLLMLGCGLEERDDFLIGRPCDPTAEDPCDPGQVCLPHEVRQGRFEAMRCRDAASFDPTGGREPPLAYCDDDTFVCPDGLVCNADRIRLDGGFRRRVCKRFDDPFAPPLDAGPGW